MVEVTASVIRLMDENYVIVNVIYHVLGWILGSWPLAGNSH